MAAPASLKQFDFGPDHKYKMNNSLTDKTDDVLECQGVGMLKRKAISVATVSGTSAPFIIYLPRHDKIAISQKSRNGPPTNC